MDTKDYTTIDKSTWGPGPWQDEADKLQYIDGGTNLPCLIVRSRVGGNLCGYVGVPAGHPYYGHEYSEIDAEVHGGLTFSDRCQPGAEDHSICHIPAKGESDDVWWLGFDCAHSGDVSPAMDARLPASLRGGMYMEYRTIDYVKLQNAHLAKQLVDPQPLLPPYN